MSRSRITLKEIPGSDGLYAVYVDGVRSSSIFVTQYRTARMRRLMNEGQRWRAAWTAFLGGTQRVARGATWAAVLKEMETGG